MESLYDKYLQRNGVTRYKVAKMSGVYISTLQRVAKSNEINNISVRILRATAETLGKTPGQVLDEMLNMEEDSN